MRRLALALLLGGCVPVIGFGIPAAYQGLWALPGQCGDALTRITGTGLSAPNTECQATSVAAAASGGILAELSCTGPGGAQATLARLEREGPRLTYRTEDGALTWERCE